MEITSKPLDLQLSSFKLFSNTTFQVTSNFIKILPIKIMNIIIVTYFIMFFIFVYIVWHDHTAEYIYTYIHTPCLSIIDAI